MAAKECIAYKSGYKYQLKKDYVTQIEIKPSAPIDTEYIKLDVNGRLTIANGYAWDGPSGPTIDTKNFMRGSLVHDALYQLIREEKLAEGPHRKIADQILKRMCREDGMFALRAGWVYAAVRWFGDSAVDPKKDMQHAPKGCP